MENRSMFTLIGGFKNRYFMRNKEVIRSKSVKHNMIEANRGENYEKKNAFGNVVEETSG